VSETLQDDPVQEKHIHIYEKCHRNLTMQCHSYHVLAEPSTVVTSRMISKPNATSDSGELMLTLSAAVPSVSLTSISVATNPIVTTMSREKYVVFRINVAVHKKTERDKDHVVNMKLKELMHKWQLNAG